MKITKAQLKQIIKEELGKVTEGGLATNKAAMLFANKIGHTFRRAKESATVEKMARYYDEMVAMAVERAPLDTSAPLEIADALGLDRESAYWSWARHHLQHLVGLPPINIESLPPSSEFVSAALERIASKEAERSQRQKDQPSREPHDGAAAYYKKYGTRGEF